MCATGALRVRMFFGGGMTGRDACPTSGESVVGSRICSSQKDVDDRLARLKMTPCPHCKMSGALIKHGFLRGYDQNHQLNKTVRAARVFCSNRHRAAGCGRTFSVWIADKIKHLFLSAESLWQFLSNAVNSGNKLSFAILLHLSVD